MKQPHFTFEELEKLHTILNGEIKEGRSTPIIETAIDKIETAMMTV